MNKTSQLNCKDNIVKFCMNDYFVLRCDDYYCYFYDIDNCKILSEIKCIKLNENMDKIIFVGNIKCTTLSTDKIINYHFTHNEIRPLESGIWKIMYLEDINDVSQFIGMKL